MEHAWRRDVELRHLRYFIAVAEEGSVTLAAERRLHTAQPSLSRQLRDLELEVGVPLLTRSARGIALTAAGRAFLDHARLALSQVEAATAAARRAAHPGKATFVMGFLTGYEVEWLAEAMQVLRDELPNIDIVISSDTSPELAAMLLRGKLDVAFMRREANMPDLEFVPLTQEKLTVVLRADHHLASRAAIEPRDLVGETFITVSETAPTLRLITDDYIRRAGLHITPDHEADNLSMAMSLIASTRGVALLPSYAQTFLPAQVVSRPLLGTAPTIDLSLGYHTTNKSQLLSLFLSRLQDLVARVVGRIENAAPPRP
jgi:LysR family hca operon transcriptional activator